MTVVENNTSFTNPFKEYNDEEELLRMHNLPVDMTGGMMVNPPRMNPSLPSGDSPGNLGSVNLWDYAEHSELQTGKEIMRPCIEFDDAALGKNQTLEGMVQQSPGSHRQRNDDHFVNVEDLFVDALFHMPIQLPVDMAGRMMVRMNPSLPSDDSPGNFDPLILGGNEEVKVLQNWKEMMQSTCKQPCFEVETPFLVCSVRHLQKMVAELRHGEEIVWLTGKQAYVELEFNFSSEKSNDVSLWLSLEPESRGGKGMMEHNSVSHQQRTFLGRFDRTFLRSLERLLDHFIIYFLKEGVKLSNGKGSNLWYLEVGNAAKKNHNVGISPALEAECRAGMMQQNLSYEGQIPESGATNEERNVVVLKSIEAKGNTSSKKKDTISRWQKDHGITRKVLQQLFDKSRDDAAKTLKVSPSTFKRACRDFGITRWPNHKVKKPNSSLNQQEDVQAVKKHKGTQPCPALPPAEATTTLQGNSAMSVKVTYKNDTVRFPLSSSSTMKHLEEQLESKLKVSLDNFSIKYQDEEDEWISLTCDSDLMYCMDVLRSSGKTITRMMVTPKFD